MPPATTLADPFPLNMLAGALKQFRPPTGAFDPNGSWQLAWNVLSLAGAAYKVGGLKRAPIGREGVVGRMQLRRSAGAKGNVRLELSYVKTGAGDASHVVEAKMWYSTAALPCPKRWELDAELRDDKGHTVPKTKIHKEASWADGELTIRDKGHTRKIAVPDAWTTNWVLFEAVQRLPRAKTKPISFTLLDHFDQVKGEQTLAYRETTGLTLGGKTIRATAYDQVGRGVLPWVYWVDDAGRLLFVVAGLEAYVLTPGE